MGLVSLARRAVSLPYEGALRLRAHLYRNGVLSSVRLPCPVVSVGNLTFGGTGKTPMVAWVAKKLATMDRKPGILSRGYGGGTEGNDEGKMLARWLPELPHVQNPDRVAGGKHLIEKSGVDIVVLDDGFQHLRLRRDLDILLLDATDPWGGGACPPGGRLREPLAASARADLVLLTRTDLVSQEQRDGVWKKLASLRSDWPRIETAFVPQTVLDTASDRRWPIDSVQGKPVVLLSAIGNPKAFRLTAQAAGLSVRHEFRFRDHHRYTQAELRGVFAADPGAIVLTTWKDWVKIADFREFRPWLLEIEPKFLQGEEFLQKKLELLSPLRSDR